jgi:hypothetical protein
MRFSENEKKIIKKKRDKEKRTRPQKRKENILITEKKSISQENTGRLRLILRNPKNKGKEKKEKYKKILTTIKDGFDRKRFG